MCKMDVGGRGMGLLSNDMFYVPRIRLGRHGKLYKEGLAYMKAERFARAREV